MSTDARKTLGRRGEQLAAEHLERLGWAIVARNHQTRFGELEARRESEYYLAHVAKMLGR